MHKGQANGNRQYIRFQLLFINQGIGNTPNRAFKLEGYLYADTYELNLNEKPENVLGKLLKQNEAKITADMRAKATKTPYSMDQIITIASIIEKEGATSLEVRMKISSVIYNRLKIKMPLQCDSSIYYLERYVHEFISGDVDRYNALYNTYKCPALPAGPICSPSLASIDAALSPNPQKYLFFASEGNGNYYFSEVYDDKMKSISDAKKAQS